VITSSGAAVLWALDELRALEPGSYGMTLRELDVTPTGSRAIVKSVGVSSRAVVAIHPTHGRLTFVDKGTPPLVAGEEIEVLEHRGSPVKWRRPGTAARTPTTTELPPPAPSTPRERSPFTSSDALARWTVRIAKNQVATPPLLAKLFDLYDRDAAMRANLITAFRELDPEATLHPDVVEFLRRDGERRVLFGFTKDIESVPIGLVAGSDAVWSYDEGALVEVADSVRAWVDGKLADLASDRPALAMRLRSLLR
jgi:hypothetical protein